MILLIAGFILSFLGSLPPGLISLSVAQTAITKGLRAAMLFAFGAAFAEFFQAWAAVVMSDWLLSYPSIEQIFNTVATIVFFALGIYLLFFAPTPSKPVEAPKVSASKLFFNGVLISTFNLLAIPFWFAYCGWLKIEGWWADDSLFYTLVFSFGVTLGTFSAMCLYGWLGTIIVQRAEQIAKQVNRLIGLMFIGLALKLLFKFF